MADVKEQKIIEYFEEAWKKNTGKEYDGISYPFARQDTWTGKVVMDFAKFILAKEEEKTKQRVNQLLQEIDKLKRVRNPYSEKIFPEPTKKQWKKRNEALEKTGLSIDQFSGSLCRLGWNNALDDVRSLIKRTFSGVVE